MAFDKLSARSSEFSAKYIYIYICWRNKRLCALKIILIINLIRSDTFGLLFEFFMKEEPRQIRRSKARLDDTSCSYRRQLAFPLKFLARHFYTVSRLIRSRASTVCNLKYGLCIREPFKCTEERI